MHATCGRYRKEVRQDRVHERRGVRSFLRVLESFRKAGEWCLKRYIKGVRAHIAHARIFPGFIVWFVVEQF